MKHFVTKLALLLGLFAFFVAVNVALADKLLSDMVASAEYTALLEDIAHTNGDGQFALSSKPFSITAVESEIKLGDARAANLRSFLGRYNSDLYDHADLMVEQADQYGFDYRLLTAIAFQESGLCAKSPENSYNCWGWGIYGGKVLRFDSYEHAIATISKGIKENYLDKGLTTASQVMAKYAPSSPGTWSRAVNHFMTQIEQQ